MTNELEPEEKPGAEPGETGEAVDEGLPGQDELPPYMRDEEPTGETNKAKYWLLKGLTKEEVSAQHDITFGTCRIAESDLVKEGLLVKKPRGSPPGAKPSKALTPPKTSPGMQVFAKGSPPEALIQAIEISGIDGQLVEFEHGMKFGMSILVTAVRLVNEMSIIGSQQVKPLLDMSKSMREGEAMTYKAGADEAALKAAQAMGATIIPQVAAIEGAVDALAKQGTAGGDPVKSMMVRTMEPLIQNLMGRMMPGMDKPDAPGWSKRKE